MFFSPSCLYVRERSGGLYFQLSLLQLWDQRVRHWGSGSIPTLVDLVHNLLARTGNVRQRNCFFIWNFFICWKEVEIIKIGACAVISGAIAFLVVLLFLSLFFFFFPVGFFDGLSDHQKISSIELPRKKDSLEADILSYSGQSLLS